MCRPFQCGAITIGWTGDEGPYHLLLTPIEIRQHSYNVSLSPQFLEWGNLAMVRDGEYFTIWKYKVNEWRAIERPNCQRWKER